MGFPFQLLAPIATLLGFFKSVEQAAGIRTRQGFHAVRLAGLDGIARDRAPGAQKIRLLLHLRMPHVFVVFTDIHEDAHLRNRLKPGHAGFPHVSGEGGDG